MSDTENGFLDAMNQLFGPGPLATVQFRKMDDGIWIASLME